ncbi:amino acid permease/ SLC12A domain-containing protein [Chytriomyces sp. MP71]|nr:amino acid permease/ SLC12A domain-containing protein [Chytriomyces sp. MP71]
MADNKALELEKVHESELDNAPAEDYAAKAIDGRHLHRRLEARHLAMIALGGTIGTGLFVGSGSTISVAGPAGVLIAYSVVGVMVYAVVTALGEMATQVPCSGAFGELSTRFLDPALGFTLGWNYYFQWLLTLPAELSAIGQIPVFWFPNVQPWVFTLIGLILLLGLNLLGVKAYGEVEYWLSLLKIVSIVIFILISTAIACGANRELGTIGFRNWNGSQIAGAPITSALAVMSCFTNAFYSYGGSELIGVTAGEAKNPKVSVPRAIKGTFWRIALFYLASLFLVGLIIPMDDPLLANTDVRTSPFTRVLGYAGVSGGPDIMNFIILVSIFSAANGAIYASTRTLQSLAANKNAPTFLVYTTKAGVPVVSIAITTFFGALALIGAYVGSGVVFNFLVNILSVSTLVCWCCIMGTHLNFRYAWRKQGRKDEELIFRAPFFPYFDIVGLLIGGIVLGYFIYNAASQPFDIVADAPYYAGLPLFVVPFLGYKVFQYMKDKKLSFGVDAMAMDFDSNENGGIYENAEDETLEKIETDNSVWSRIVRALA